MIIFSFLAIAFLTWVMFGFFGRTANNQPVHSEANYERALSSESKEDICATPPGYSDESWREHMSHHPDRYAKCLKR